MLHLEQTCGVKENGWDITYKKDVTKSLVGILTLKYHCKRNT